MPTPTTRLRARLIDSGTELNTWGTNLNDQVFSLLDEAIAGVEKISLTGSNGNMALSSMNYASDQSRNAALIFQGTPSVDVTVAIPAVEKVYVTSNQTAKAVTLTAGGLTVTLAAGDRAVVWCDGTDCGYGSIGAQTVNGLIANAQLAGANLPGQAGNQGKFLQTDGAVPQWASVVIPAVPDFAGGADATITTAASLTASSSVVQSVDMAAAAQSVKLPDATTLSKGGRKFVVLGVGNRTFGVRDAAGTLLTVVPAGGAAELHLRDNATAAGAWGVTGRGLEPALTLVDHTAPATIPSAVEMAVRLTDNLSIHFAQSGAGLNAVAVDSTPGASAVGAWTGVDLSAGTTTPVQCFRISDTQAIAFWVIGTNHKAAVLTVDPATRVISVANAASTTSPFLLAASFSGRPVIAQMTPTLFVVLHGTDAAYQGNSATAVSVAGNIATIGAAAAVGITGTSGTAVPLACYRISDTTALAIYSDNSGTSGTPFSIRAAVLTVSGTTITVGASAGINDVFAGSGAPLSCQLSSSKVLVAYAQGLTVRAVVFTASGTSVSVGTPLTVETLGATPDSRLCTWGYGGDSRFQPNLYAMDSSRALLTYSDGPAATQSRHAVLSEAGGALTAGAILYSLWPQTPGGGNFSQTPAGFLAFSTATAEMAVFAVTVNGTTLAVTGEFSDGAVSPLVTASARFGLSGGVCGVQHDSAARSNLFHLFKFAANGAPRYLGPLRLNDFTAGAFTPVEVAASKVAIISGAGAVQPTATGNNVRLQIVEFAQ